MDRLTFLKSMLGNAALLTLPPLELLPKAEQDRLAWTTDCHLIFIYDTYIRGFQFHQGPKLIKRIKDEDTLDLVREYDNEHDDNAVAVYWEGHKLGYLPMFENVSLAYMLDHGLLLQCHVVYTQPKAEPWEQCFIAVDLLVPRHPSFDAYITHYMDRPDAGFKRRPEYDGDKPPTAQPDPYDKPSPKKETLLKNGKVLELLSLQRFRLFMHAVLDLPDPPICVQSFMRDVAEEGIVPRTNRIGQHGESLSLRILGHDHFRIRFEYAGGHVGDGGEWDVIFDSVGTVQRIECREHWIA
ncbi:MAG: HIRAN domain-containing protein [Flavobacteriales bacterium]|nr:HIRAN domain-containing protein [Flavobacteriales bacterium]